MMWMVDGEKEGYDAQCAKGGGSEKVLNLKQLLHFSSLSGDAEW